MVNLIVINTLFLEIKIIWLLFGCEILAQTPPLLFKTLAHLQNAFSHPCYIVHLMWERNASVDGVRVYINVLVPVCTTLTVCEMCPVFLAVTGAHLIRLYERYQSLDKDNKGHLT